MFYLSLCKSMFKMFIDMIVPSSTVHKIFLVTKKKKIKKKKKKNKKDIFASEKRKNM